MNPTSANPFDLFIGDCEVALALYGTAQSGGARVLDTPGLYVRKGEGLSLDIRIRYVTQYGSCVADNPVACRDANGRLYRTHGEWVYALQRVKRLLAGERPQAPIRVNLACDNAYKAGLD